MKTVYLVKDERVGFLNILCDENDYIAKFNFGRGFAQSKPEFGRLEDYSLYKVGFLDVNDFDFSTKAEFICNGLTAYNDFITHVNNLKILSATRGDDDNADSNI